MMSGAILSECGTFRYHLFRKWEPEHGKHLAFVMLNPSTADAEEDDPTIRKCVGFAKRLGFRGIDVVNLYAYRATKPADLRAAGYPVGPHNDEWIIETARQTKAGGGAVVVAWGAIGNKLERPLAVVRSLRFTAGVNPYTLKVCGDGNPAHPLMLPYSCTLQAF